MGFGGIIALALGLAMDATAVAGAKGLAARRIRARDAILVAAYFGGFQAFMPIVGWYLGSSLGSAAAAWDHWIAFLLLAGIGGKMLWDAGRSKKRGDLHVDNNPDKNGDADRERDPFAFRHMIVLSVATSIDALAAGITLPMLKAPLVLSVATIGITTAILSAAGLFAGRRFGAILGRRLDAVGGLVLVGLGLKILLEHTGRF
jgi:manganese efflux pump family protein